jgi:hypothetical protein
MTDVGLFSNRFFVNTEALRKFDESVRFFRIKRPLAELNTNRDKVQNLLRVLQPIRDGLNGKLSESMVIDDQGVVKILRDRHSLKWQSYRAQINDITTRLEDEKIELSHDDLVLLNDIADALDSHCATLFRRIRG